MSYLTENANLIFPITEADCQQALSFSKQQPTAEKAEQVYRNTLAMLVVEQYLEILDIEVDHSQSYSWKPITQLSSGIADLYIPEARGRLECRPIKPGEQKCVIPAELLDEESWFDRIGLVVVELNETFTVGTLLGFVPQVVVEELPLSYLRSLDDLIDRICTAQTPIDIKDLTRRVFSAGWEQVNRLTRRPIVLAAPASEDNKLDDATIQYLIQGFYAEDSRPFPGNEHASGSVSPEQALVHLMQTTQSERVRFKAAELLLQVNPHHPNSLIATKRNLGLLLQGHTIDLIVCVLPKPDGNYLICARAESSKGALPNSLTLTGIDNENASTFFEVSKDAFGDEWYIQHLFVVHPGDLFSLRVSLDDAQITENFVV